MKLRQELQKKSQNRLSRQCKENLYLDWYDSLIIMKDTSRNLYEVIKCGTYGESRKIRRYYHIFASKSGCCVADLCGAYEAFHGLPGTFYWCVLIQGVITLRFFSKCQFYLKQSAKKELIWSFVNKVFNEVIKFVWTVPQIWFMRVSLWKKNITLHFWVTFNTNNN